MPAPGTVFHRRTGVCRMSAHGVGRAFVQEVAADRVA